MKLRNKGKKQPSHLHLTISSDATYLTYRISKEGLAGFAHSADGVVHIPLARKAVHTSVQGLRHCLSHLHTHMDTCTHTHVSA